MFDPVKWEDDLKRYETYSVAEIPPNSYFAIRVDGKNFHTEVKKLGMKRPFDKTLRDAMVEASIGVMKEFMLPLAYTESDEVTFLFPSDYAGYMRRPEKLATLVAAKMSVGFNNTKLVKGSNTSPIFDARVLVLPTKKDVDRCFNWRLIDSKRNCISTYCFWTLVKSGISKHKAQHMLDGLKDNEKINVLIKNGIKYDNVSDWERLGTFIKVEEYEKDGYDPIKKVAVKAIRKRYVAVDAERSEIFK